MKPRTLLVLFAVVVGLSAFIWFYERKLPSSEERAEQAKKLLHFEKKDVTAIAIEQGGRKLRLERIATPPKKEVEKKEDDESELAADAEDAGQWRIVEPLAARADASLVASLFEALLGITKTRTLENPDPKALGLDHPQAVVRLTTRDGEKVLKLGAKVPTGAALIAAIGGDPEAYVVSDAVLTALDRPAGDWRDRQILHVNREDVQRIKLRGGQGPVVLARRGEDFWLESPVRDRADRDLVETLLSNLTGLSVSAFVDAADKSPAHLGLMGLAPPQGVVEVTAKGAGSPLRVELGAPAAPPAGTEEAGIPPSPTRYARVGTQVFETQTGLGDDLGRLPADWRSRALSGFEVYQVESVKAKDAKGETALARAGTDWKRGNETISYTPVSDLLFAATGGRADRLVTPEEAKALGAALDQPVLTLVLAGKSGKGAETLGFYPPTAEGVPVRSSARQAILLLPRDVLAEIQKNLAAVRAAKPVPPGKGGAEGEAAASEP